MMQKPTARERLLGGVRVAMLTERSWCDPVRCVPQASPGSGRRASSTATFTTRLARPSRYALALGSIGHPRRHRPPRARCLPVRADHRRFVRDEEGRLGRQALQPWHLGARSPLSVVMAGLAKLGPDVVASAQELTPSHHPDTGHGWPRALRLALVVLLPRRQSSHHLLRPHGPRVVRVPSDEMDSEGERRGRAGVSHLPGRHEARFDTGRTGHAGGPHGGG